MAALTVNAADVALARTHENGLRSYPAAAAFDAGTYVTTNASGQVVAGGGAGGAIAIRSAHNAGDAVTVVRSGIVDVGDALAGLAYGAQVYAAPAGNLDDAATGNTPVGRVEPGLAETDGGKKLLRVEL